MRNPPFRLRDDGGLRFPNPPSALSPHYRSDSIGTQKLALDQRAPDRFWLLVAQDQRRGDCTVPSNCIHDRFQFLRGRHENLENETVLSGQPQHFHDVRHFGKLLQAGLNMFVGRAQADDGHHPQPERGRIDLRGIAGDDSALLQSLDPL